MRAKFAEVALLSGMYSGKVENRFCVLLFMGAALLVIAIPVHAQEADVVDWTGPYVGLHAGTRWANIETHFFHPASAEESSGSKAIWGAQFGYKKQFGKWVLGEHSGEWVLGVEGDGSWGRQSQSITSSLVDTVCYLIFPPGTPMPFTPPFPPGTKCGPSPVYGEVRSISTLADASTRVTAGFTAGQWLIYGTGGLAVAQVHATAQDSFVDPVLLHAGEHCAATDPSCLATDRNSKTPLGWTLGFGVEMFVGRNISIGAEYHHSDFGHSSFAFENPVFSGNGASFLSNPLPISMALTDDQGTLRVNYRFH